jgi:hypothetical protein
VADWHQALQEAGLHARAEFDVVAPFNGSERQLYTDLATLLPTRRQQLAGIVDALALQAREHAGGRACASQPDRRGRHAPRAAGRRLCRRAAPAAFVREFQDGVRRHARRAVDGCWRCTPFAPTTPNWPTCPRWPGAGRTTCSTPRLKTPARAWAWAP